MKNMDQHEKVCPPSNNDPWSVFSTNIDRDHYSLKDKDPGSLILTNIDRFIYTGKHAGEWTNGQADGRMDGRTDR